LESDARFEAGPIIEILRENYPFVGMEKRITVLKWLCDHFLETDIFRQLISSDGVPIVSFLNLLESLKEF
jgi:hypothetical protein